MALVAADQSRGLIKVNPLFDQTREQILAFVQTMPFRSTRFTAKGFASIGCAPCTRAISPGEPERAGRWWWEDDKQPGVRAAPEAGVVKRRYDSTVHNVRGVTRNQFDGHGVESRYCAASPLNACAIA